MPDIDADEPAALLPPPAPLTISARTRAGLGRDWGSREGAFIARRQSVRARLPGMAGGAGRRGTVPIPGSFTFAVQEAVQNLVPGDGRLLVLTDGAHGRRIADIGPRIGRIGRVAEVAEDQPIPPGLVRAALADDPAITDAAHMGLKGSTIRHPGTSMATRGPGRPPDARP